MPEPVRRRDKKPTGVHLKPTNLNPFVAASASATDVKQERRSKSKRFDVLVRLLLHVRTWKSFVAERRGGALLETHTQKKPVPHAACALKIFGT